MEEILASIRRIISDDQEAMRVPAEEEETPSPLRNVLDLTERHISPILSPEPFAGEEAWGGAAPIKSDPYQADGFCPDIVKTYRLDRAAPQSAAPSGTAPAPVPAEEALLSRKASASVSEAFVRLDSVLAPAQPKTVEELMKEMLRPLLKQWLDDNLPAVVERLVQAEIERATRGRG